MVALLKSCTGRQTAAARLSSVLAAVTFKFRPGSREWEPGTRRGGQARRSGERQYRSYGATELGCPACRDERSLIERVGSYWRHEHTRSESSCCTRLVSVPSHILSGSEGSADPSDDVRRGMRAACQVGGVRVVLREAGLPPARTRLCSQNRVVKPGWINSLLGCTPARRARARSGPNPACKRWC